jgi:glutaconate CoA-transferase subunit B
MTTITDAELLAGADLSVVDFLVRAAREFRRGGYVFTGFHWPVLAGQVAHALEGEPFTQAFEAGAMTHAAGRIVPTSTTDYPAYGNALGYVGTTADILLAMARRFDRVVLDASNVDIRGRVNASYIGDLDRPQVRLPGGGGAADVAARARELVWLSGGPDFSRIQASVDHVTSAPGPASLVRLHTRWGIAVLGDDPRLEELADVPGAEAFVAHMSALGVTVGSPAPRGSITHEERLAAAAVLRDAADRGYQVGRRAFAAATTK